LSAEAPRRGFLRARADIAFGSDPQLARLTHGIWEIDFPAFPEDPALRAFAERKADIWNLGEEARWAQFARMVDEMGALSFEPADIVDTRGLHAAHSCLSVEWYARYHAHPFWKRLVSGEATSEQVRNWALRTYFLSRSVGATAATGALFSRDARCRRAFFKNALAEYDHYEQFYRVAGSGPGGQGHAGEQLPISRMIDEHFAAIAECDEWGHALSALYQERTAMFGKAALKTYARIEELYGPVADFPGWSAHLGVDLDEDHAGEFAGLFSDPEPLSTEESVSALLHSWASAMLITASLEELMEPCEPSPSSGCEAPRWYVLRRLRFILLRALGGTLDERYIVRLGDLVRAVDSLVQKPAQSVAWNAPVRLDVIIDMNRLHRLAAQPEALFAALGTLLASNPFCQTLSAIDRALPERSRGLLQTSETSLDAGARSVPHAHIAPAQLLGSP
jgi:pyrroloquinoline quinone (PQQ) biosynthesis protein C